MNAPVKFRDSCLIDRALSCATAFSSRGDNFRAGFMRDIASAVGCTGAVDDWQLAQIERAETLLGSHPHA